MRSVVAVAQGLGLAHDARNLIGALGLYCDLLSRPGVLKPEHTHYAAELGLLGTRSATLLQRLMLSLATPAPMSAAAPAASPIGLRRPVGLRPSVSLREIVEHCSGLLRGVAGGRRIELAFGPAASTPVLAAEEDVERVLVNLVRNAAAALEFCHPPPAHRRRSAPSSRGEKNQLQPSRLRDGSAQAVHPIRISIGMVDHPPTVPDHTIGPQAWPSLHCRLSVEDSGCGMDAKQLARLLAGVSGSLILSGIGFQVVRELVATNGASLSVRSAPGKGTCIQIEWPAQVELPVSLPALAAAPTPLPQLPWLPIPVASVQSVHVSQSRWTA